MSILNFPRIYMNGHMYWNPPTANNNDLLPVYDGVQMALNWDFLNDVKVEPPLSSPLTPQDLNKWLITPLQASSIPGYVLEVPSVASQFPMIPAEWNLFGDNACGTVQFEDIKSTVIGGETGYDHYVSDDALISLPYQMVGNPFGSDAPTPARFVDVSPWQNTFTALFFDKLVIGDENCGLTAAREYRMLDKFLNFTWGALGGLTTVTTTWQTCFPAGNLAWATGESNLLNTLKTQMTDQKAKGLMFRFSSFLTFYDQNGIFNDYPKVTPHSSGPDGLQQLQEMYQKGLDNVADIFFNPAYSRTAGTLGLWFEDEFPTTPGGRRLIPRHTVPLYKMAADDGVDVQPDAVQPPVSLGVALAECVTDPTSGKDVLSFDLLNTFPFYAADPSADVPVAEKYYAGTFDVGTVSGSSFTKVASISYDQYDQPAFDKRSGLLDIPLTTTQKQALESGELELRLQGAPKDEEVASEQLSWTAEVVESASFINVGDSRTLTIMVQNKGLPAPVDTVLWVAEYNNPFMITTSNYYLAFNNDADFPLFKNFPGNAEKNKPVLPQFSAHIPITVPAGVGSGRNVAPHVAEAVPAAGTGEIIKYQAYRQYPSSLSLAPKLRFTDPIKQTGHLDDSNSTIEYNLTKIKTGSGGIATLTVDAIEPGFPTLRFFVQEGTDAPAVPFSFQLTDAYTDYLSPLRILPQDPKLMEDFVSYWNQVYQDEQARMQIWLNFIYPKILKPFYYLYPIMDKYMPLDSLSRIEGAIDQFIVLISKEYQEESTLAMPITRDLSQSRRAVLERWAKELVKRNYPPQKLSP